MDDSIINFKKHETSSKQWSYSAVKDVKVQLQQQVPAAVFRRLRKGIKSKRMVPLYVLLSKLLRQRNLTWSSIALNIPRVSLRKTYNVKKLNEPIEHVIFLSQLLGFPLGYLVKPIPHFIAMRIHAKVDMMLAQEVAEYVARIEQKLEHIYNLGEQHDF